MSERSVPIPRPVWESLLKSCGLRRREWEQLRVRDIRRDATGRIWLHIGEEAGIAAREVPVVGGFEWAICDVLARRFPSTPEEAVSFAEAIATRSPDDFVFSLVPPRLNIDQGRREYASWLYYSLLSSQEQVQDSHTFEAVGEQVRLALGLPRIDATIRRCIRQARVETQRKKQGRRKTRSEWGGGSSRGELVRWPRQHPDLGEQEWQEDGEFVHGYVNGAYYRMVCSRVELEEARTQMQQEAGQPIETGDVWWWLGVRSSRSLVWAI